MERSTAAELMDDPAVDAAELAENFTDIERANAWFGGARPVVREVFARDARRVLDVGCGSADIPRALLAEGRRRGVPLQVVGLDRSATVLAIARERSKDEPELSFVQAEGEALPFGDGEFDVATCNLALHHFDPPAAVTLLRELRRVSRVAPVVCDLRRSRLGYVATRAFAALIARNRLTKHDAPLSVLRAYSPGEALDLARRAGWHAPQVRRDAFFRMVLSDGAPTTGSTTTGSTTTGSTTTGSTTTDDAVVAGYEASSSSRG
jgi:SAM-dependent methyltransferase